MSARDKENVNNLIIKTAYAQILEKHIFCSIWKYLPK